MRTTYTRYVVLPDGKTFDILDDCRIVDVPDDIDDVEGYILDGKTQPTFKDTNTPMLWREQDD